MSETNSSVDMTPSHLVLAIAVDITCRISGCACSASHLRFSFTLIVFGLSHGRAPKVAPGHIDLVDALRLSYPEWTVLRQT